VSQQESPSVDAGGLFFFTSLSSPPLP
jgi:hypothetical protein